MIAACACEGWGKEAIELYKCLASDGLSPNARTFVSLLDACASSGLLLEGQWIHSHLKTLDLESNLIVGTALVNFYGKCGNLDLARKLFGRLTTKDVVSWNAMLTALAQHAEGKETLHLFEQMKRDGVRPNEVTFCTVLSVCCHCGMVSEGRDCFVSMARDYGLNPNVEHYNILVDILVRAGRLCDAEDLIYTMPYRPWVSSWRTLLSGCRKYGDVELGKLAAKYACDLDSSSDSTYVILSELLM
jgi:pentatricopeptide repeat protein